MNRTKLLLSGLLGAVLLLASSARAQDEVGHHEAQGKVAYMRNKR